MNQNFKKHLEASYARAFEECARTGHKIGDLDAIFNSIAMATFAELIVKECMTICKNHPSRIVSNNWDADAVAPHLVQQFEKHFGVTE